MIVGSTCLTFPLQTAATIAALLLSGAAMAQATAAAAAPASDFSVSGNATFATDYVWRGLSQTWSKPTLQATLEVAHTSGFYVGFFGSNVAAQFIPNANLETDWYGGYRGKAGDISYDLNAVYVVYPGSNYDKASFVPAYDSANTASVEVYADLGYKWFNLRYGRFVTKFFGWNVNNSGVGVFNSLQPQAGLTGSSKGSQNLEVSAAFEVSDGLTLKGSAGRQQIPHSVDTSWTYYSLAATKTLPGNWSAGLSLWGTSGPKAFKKYGSLTNNGETSTPSRTTLVLAVSKSF